MPGPLAPLIKTYSCLLSYHPRLNCATPGCFDAGWPTLEAAAVAHVAGGGAAVYDAVWLDLGAQADGDPARAAVLLAIGVRVIQTPLSIFH